MRYGLAPTCSLYPCCLPGASWIPTVHWFCVILALFHVKQQGKPTALLSSARTNTETRLCKLCHILAAGDVSSSCVSPLCNSSIRRSDFAVFRQAFLQKGRPLRAAAPCTVPPTRAVRAAALSFFVRHGKPAQGAQKSPQARQFSPQRPVFALPKCPCLSRRCARPPPCPWWRRTRQCHGFPYIIWRRPPVLHASVPARLCLRNCSRPSAGYASERQPRHRGI